VKCSLCGKGGCRHPQDRNVDGTYAHADCLYANAYTPAQIEKPKRKEKP
jgi:hypothetical protein